MPYVIPKPRTTAALVEQVLRTTPWSTPDADFVRDVRYYAAERDYTPAQIAAVERYALTRRQAKRVGLGRTSLGAPGDTGGPGFGTLVAAVVVGVFVANLLAIALAAFATPAAVKEDRP